MKTCAEGRRACCSRRSSTHTGSSLQDLVTAIDATFREIAIDVVLQDAEEIIAVRVAAIAGRLPETRSNRPLLLEAQSNHNASSADILSTEGSAVSDPTSHLSETEGSLSDLLELWLSF